MPSPYHVTRLLSQTQPPSSSPTSVSSRGSGGSSNKWGPYSSGADFDAYVVMIVAILLCSAAIILSLFAAVRFIIRRRRCARSPPPPPTEVGEDPEEAEKRKQRDGSELAKALPVVVFKEGSAELAGEGADGQAECAICLSEFVEGDGVRVIPACRHGFHGMCIERWFQTKSSCPTCRCSCRRTALAVAASEEP